MNTNQTAGEEKNVGRNVPETPSESVGPNHYGNSDAEKKPVDKKAEKDNIDLDSLNP